MNVHNIEFYGIGEDTIFKLLASLEEFSLEELSLVGCSNVKSFTKIMPVIARHLSLCKLSIIQCEIENAFLALFGSNLQNFPLLNSIILSGNNIKKGDELNYFLFAVQCNLDNIKIDLSQNNLDDTCVIDFEENIFYVDNSICELDISFNQFTKKGIWHLMNSYGGSPSKDNLKIECLPFPFEKSILSSKIQQDSAKSIVELDRYSRMEGKFPPCKKEDYTFIDQIDFRVKKYLKESEKIEILFEICQDIHSQSFIFPYRKLEIVKDAIWDNILISLEVKDFYVLDLMLKCACFVSLDISPLTKQIEDAQFEVHSKLIELTNLLNLRIVSGDINEKLTEVLRVLIGYNVRGTLIDIGLGVKHSLEEILQMPSVFNRASKEEIEELAILGEYFIDGNLEYAEVKENSQWEYPKDLYLHPKLVDYSSLSEIDHSLLVEILEKCQNSSPSDYFEQNMNNRVFFLLADHRFQFVEHIWNLCKDDFLLNFSRILIQYRDAASRDEMNYDKHNWVKKPVVIVQDVNRKKGCHIPSLSFEDFPNLRSGDVKVKRESFFGFIEKKARQSISAAMGNQEESPLKFYSGPIRKSIRNGKTQEFRKFGSTLYEKFCKICEFMDSYSPYNSRLFILTKEFIEILWRSREIHFLSEVKRTDVLAFLLQEDPDALIDEAYFQFYRFMNRELSTDNRIFRKSSLT